MVRRYEMALVASPQLPPDEHDKLLTSFEQLIADMGGTVQKVEPWGRRKLAYPINKFHEGVYTLFLYDATPEVEREFIRRVKLNDAFIRFLSVRADHAKTPTPEEKAQIEQARKDYLQRAQERAAQGLLGADDDLGVLPLAGVVPAEGEPAEDEFTEDEEGGEREDER